MLRAAALRPINVTMLVIGAGVFATTLVWWLLPLTIVTYASLVFLAARDPIFQRKVLGGGEVPKTSPNAVESSDVSPERRARWLPRGETRQKVEAALDVYRKVVAAIETSDDVTRTVLDDVVPRLHAAADRLGVSRKVLWQRRKRHGADVPTKPQRICRAGALLDPEPAVDLHRIGALLDAGPDAGERLGAPDARPPGRGLPRPQDHRAA